MQVVGSHGCHWCKATTEKPTKNYRPWGIHSKHNQTRALLGRRKPPNPSATGPWGKPFTGYGGAQKLETFLPWSWVQWKMGGVCPIVVPFQKIRRHFPVNHEYGRTGKMEPAIKSCLKNIPRNPCLDRKLLRAQFWRTDCLICIGNRAQWQTKCSSSTTIFYFKILAKLATRFIVQISGKNDRWIIATFFARKVSGQFCSNQLSNGNTALTWHEPLNTIFGEFSGILKLNWLMKHLNNWV